MQSSTSVGTRRDGGRFEADIREDLNITRDRVRWGPIIAGVVTALTTLLLLGLLGLAVGLTALYSTADIPGNSGTASAVWAAVSGLVAFFLGGFLASRTAAVFNRGWGIVNGMLVFLVTIPLSLFLAGSGIGALLGSVGSFASGLNIDPAQIQGAVQGTPTPAPNPNDLQRAAEATRNAAVGALGGSLLGLAAAAIGGAVGTRRKVEVSPTTGNIRD